MLSLGQSVTRAIVKPSHPLAPTVWRTVALTRGSAATRSLKRSTVLLLRRRGGDRRIHDFLLEGLVLGQRAHRLAHRERAQLERLLGGERARVGLGILDGELQLEGIMIHAAEAFDGV